MAVSLRTAKFTDKIRKKRIDVHYISVNNSNKKGSAEAIGGFLFQGTDVWNPWWIELDTTVNGRKVRKSVVAGDIVFRTGNNKRWQVAKKTEFNKRFALAR